MGSAVNNARRIGSLAVVVLVGTIVLTALPGPAQARTADDICAGHTGGARDTGFITQSDHFGIQCSYRFDLYDDATVTLPLVTEFGDMKCPPNFFIKGTSYWSRAFAYNWGFEYWVDGGYWVLWDGGIKAGPDDGVLEGGFEAYNSLQITLENWRLSDGTGQYISVRPWIECQLNPVARAKSGPAADAPARAPDEPPGAGGPGDDDLEGNDNHNALVGFAGDDHLHGGAGRDHLHGGTGDDVLVGAAHDDLIHARAHSDRVAGGNGNDDILTGQGDDVARGGKHGDQLFDDEGRDELRGGAGNDRFSARDGDRDLIRCGAGEDIAIIDSKDRAIECEHAYRNALETPAVLPEV